MSASVFSAEGGGHHRGESKRKRRNSENKKIEAQEEGKEQKMMAGRGRGDSVDSSEDETDANGRSVKKQLLSFWLTMEEKEKSEGSGFVRVQQQQGRAATANKGPTGGRGHPGGLKHRSRSFDNKNDFLLDQLTSSSPPSASTTTDQDDDKEHHLTVGSSSSGGSSARRGRDHHHHHHHQLNTRGGSGGRGLQTFHARNHSFSSPMPFHLATTSLPSSPAAMSPPSPLNASSCSPVPPPSLSFSPATASLRHFSSSPSLPAVGPLALPFRFGPDAQADLRRSASRHGEEEWERADEDEDGDGEKKEKESKVERVVAPIEKGREEKEETKQEEETKVEVTCSTKKEGEKKEEPRKREEVVVVVESREEDEKEKESAEDRVKSPVTKANSFRHSPTFLALQQALDDEKRQEKKEAAKQLSIAQSASASTLRVEPRPATSPTPARAAAISPPSNDPSKIFETKSIVDGPSTSAMSEEAKQAQEAREKESAAAALAAAADEERSRREAEKKQEEEETKRREEEEAAKKRKAEEELKSKEEAVKRAAEEEQRRKEEAAQREKQQKEREERAEREAAERARKEEEAKERQAKLEQEEKAKKEEEVRQQEEERRRQVEDDKRRQRQEEEEEEKRKLVKEKKEKQEAAQRTSSDASSSDSAERAESDKGGGDVEARLEEVKRTYDARLGEEAKKLQLAEGALCAEREKRRELEKQNKKLLERLRETELLLKIAQQKEKKLRLEKKRRSEEDEDLKNAAAAKKANAKATKKPKSEDDSDEDDDDDAKKQADDQKAKTKNTSTGESESDSAPPSLETSTNGVPTRTAAASKPQRLRCRASQSDQETDTTDVETDATETEEDTSDDSSASSEETSDSESTDDEDECEVSESDTTADEAKQMERRKTKVPAVVLVDMPLRRSAEKKKSGTRKANSEGEDDKTEDDVADKRAKTSREYVKQAHHRVKAANDSMTKDLMGLDDQRSAKRKSARSGKDKGMAEKSEAQTAKKEKKERKKGEEECDDDEVASTTTTKKLSRKVMKKNHGSLLRVFKGKAKKSSSPRANETAPSGLAKQIAKQRKKAQKEMEEREREKEKKEKKRRAREERKRREEEEAAAAAVEEERQQQHKQSLLSPSEGHRPRGASFDHRMDDADWEWQISETDSVTDESDVDRKAARQQREKERREVLSAKGACSASSPNLTTAPFVTPPPPPPPPGGIRSSHAATSSPPTPPLPPPAHSISLPSLRRKNLSNASSPPAQQSGELSPTGEDKETPRGRAQRRTIAVPNKEKDKEKRKKREKARSKEDSDASFDSSSDVEARKRSGASAHTADHPSVNWRLSMKPGELMQFGSFLELRPTKEVITKRPKGIFGAPLESLCDAQAPVPSFLEQAFLYLEEKALRTTGLFDWDVEASTVQFLRSALEGTGEVDFDSYGTHAVAELIKHFLECLPEPLVPRHLYTAFVASSDVQCRNFKVNALHQHLSQLSFHARELVQRLCGFLTLYIKHSAHNKTTAGKLSAVFGPLVLRPTEEEGFKDTSFIQLNSSRTKRKCASAFQVLIAEYETLFLHMPQVARYVVKDGQVLLQAAALPQLVEQMLDENFKEAGVADIVFLTHTYFTTSVDLLRELISIFDKNRKAEGKTWSHRLRMRILQLLKDWVVAYGTDLAEDADFVNAINKFTKPGADSKCSPIAEEDGLFAQIRFLLFSLEQKRKAPARLIRNLSSLNGVMLQGQGPLSINLHGIKQPGASSLPPSPHGAQSQEDLARFKSSDALNIWASSPTILSGLPRTYSGSGASYTTTPRTSQPSSPYHSSSSVATRAPQSDNEDDESTQYDTQGEEEDSADDSDAAVGEERSSRDLARHVRIGDDEFLDLDAEETAKQLTLIDNQLFRGIPKKELLNKRFMTPDTSPHFTAMVQRFNLTASWVGSVVFEYEQPARRAKAISLLIDICQASLRLNNYNTVFALLAGLNNTAVSRLKLTWERVSRKHMRRYKEMMAVVSDAKNHSAYRQELLKARPPVVPYLALFSKDLFGVEESNTTITSDGLINFGKMRLIAKLVSHFTSCQVTFPIAIDPALRALLKGVQPLSENELYERSYRLEPRKNT